MAPDLEDAIVKQMRQGSSIGWCVINFCLHKPRHLTNLTAKDGPIMPLIAETGGINAMRVGSTARPEQVCDAVALSFRSVGQRCSARRVN